jgi:peptidoglycan/LPS O-acetylase OafA/YrhL
MKTKINTTHAETRLDLDPLRGFVCISIVIMHLYNSSVRADLEEWSGPNLAFVIIHIRLGFESFFVLAGFFVAHSFRASEANYLSIPNFLIRRLSRLVVPYWIAFFIATMNLVIPNVILGHHNQIPTVSDWFVQFLCIQNWVGVPTLGLVYWSIPILIQSYFLFAMVFWLIRQILLRRDPENSHTRTEAAMWWLMWIVAIASLVDRLLDDPDQTGLLKYGIYIVLGWMTYQTIQLRAKHRHLFCLGIASIYCGIVTESSRLIAAQVTVCLLLILGRGYQLPRTLPIRLLAYLGMCSYSIYLLHAVIGYRILNLSNHLRDLSSGEAWILFMIAIAASILGSIGFFHLVEKPWSNLARGIRYRK